MPRITFSERAEADLQSIDAYTADTRGDAQADLYLDRIRVFCLSLAQTPGMGRIFNPVRPDLRRIQHGGHVIFYRQIADGILITRILHQSMLPTRHPLDES